MGPQNRGPGTEAKRRISWLTLCLVTTTRSLLRALQGGGKPPPCT
jgi:hypothetical protein